MKFSHLVEINVGLFVRVDAWDGWKESERCMKPTKIKPLRMYSLYFFFFFLFPFLSFLLFVFLFHHCPTILQRSFVTPTSSSTDVKGLKVFAAGNNKLCRASGNSWRGEIKSKKFPRNSLFRHAFAPRLMKDDSVFGSRLDLTVWHFPWLKY